MPRVLYITYTGLMQPLGQSQVLNYLRPIAQTHEVHVLSFERSEDYADAARLAELKEDLAAHKIGWSRLRYHKRPAGVATLWDLFRGLLVGGWVAWRHRCKIVHCRSYVPSVIGLFLHIVLRTKFLFDMRGFWPDERVDGGLWRENGGMYRIGKWFERRFLLNADAVVSLTHSAVREIERFDYLQGRTPTCYVITTCTDLEHFRPMPKPEGSPPLTIGYVGAAGVWYLFAETARAMKLALDRRPDARLLIVNRNEHEAIRLQLREAGVPEDRFEITSAAFAEMPSMIARMDAVVFFLKPAFSKKASAPTRLGELLACGKPCLVNTGVGDMQQIVTDTRTGVCIEEVSDEQIASGVDKLLELLATPNLTERCRRAAEEHFSLDRGVEAYLNVYNKLLGKETD